MKTTILILLAAIMFSCTCNNEKNSNCEINTQNVKNNKVYDVGMQTIEHDGCEYILYKDNGRSDIALIHKPTCRFCQLRNEQK